jgi:beta-glucosidase-like glycosyl hydrolase
MHHSLFIFLANLDSTFTEYLVQLVEEGEVSMQRIDDSVRRVLEMKDKLGLFENPVPALSDPLLEVFCCLFI